MLIKPAVMVRGLYWEPHNNSLSPSPEGALETAPLYNQWFDQLCQKWNSTNPSGHFIQHPMLWNSSMCPSKRRTCFDSLRTGLEALHLEPSQTFWASPCSHHYHKTAILILNSGESFWWIVETRCRANPDWLIDWLTSCLLQDLTALSRGLPSAGVADMTTMSSFILGFPGQSPFRPAHPFWPEAATRRQPFSLLCPFPQLPLSQSLGCSLCSFLPFLRVLCCF